MWNFRSVRCIACQGFEGSDGSNLIAAMVSAMDTCVDLAQQVRAQAGHFLVWNETNPAGVCTRLLVPRSLGIISSIHTDACRYKDHPLAIFPAASC